MSTADAARGASAARTGFIAYFAANPVAANLLMAFLIVGGVISGLHLAVQSFPDLDTRTVTVTVPFPGSSPREVEEDINRRVEEAVVGLPGVERVVSTASQNLGRIDVEVADFADVSDVLEEVRGAVDRIENFPPRSAERPEVKVLRAAMEVMTLAVSSSQVAENELRLAAEGLRDGLLGLPSISQVRLDGTRDREIAIELSEEELRRNDLSINQVANAIQRASLNLTFGELRTEAGGGGPAHCLQAARRGRVQEHPPHHPARRHDRDRRRRRGDPGRIRRRGDRLRVQWQTRGVRARLGCRRASVVDIADEIKHWLATWETPQDVTVSVWNDRAEPSSTGSRRSSGTR